MNATRLAVVVLLATAPAPARADDPPPAVEAPPAMEAPFQLYVNYVAKGDVVVLLQGDDVLADPRDLEAAGLTLPPGRVVEIDGRRMISLQSISPPLRYEIDERDIALRITAPSNILPRTMLDLRGAPPDVTYSTATSAFVNYAAYVRPAEGASLYEETGLSVGGHLLLSSAIFNTEAEPLRGMSSFVLNDRESLTRCTFGDAFVATGPLGGGAFVGGATVSRTYEFDPYAVKLPGLGFAGSTLAPATLDVYVNGQRIRSEPIPPGRFELSNLYTTSGHGVATYVVRDVFGAEHEISEPYYSTNMLLADGIHEYTYSMGVLRRDAATESWSYGRPAALGSHRIGLTDRVTTGGRIEIREARASGGPMLTLATLVGQLDFDLAGSYDAAGAGVASQAAYSYSSIEFSGALFARATSNRYATLELAPAHDRSNAEVGLSLSVPIASLASFSYRASVSKMRDSGLTADFGARVLIELARALSWSVSAGHTARTESHHDWIVSTSIGYGFYDQHRADASAELVTGEPAGRLDVSKSLSKTEDYAYRASAVLAESSSAQLSAQYQAKVGRVGARYLVRDTREMSLEAAGGIVAVPGIGIFPTLPVQGSFGVIRVKDLPGVRAYGNGQEVGRTDLRGNVVVPNMLAYYGNRLEIETADIPFDREVQATTRLVAPPMRGVAIAEFAAPTPHYFRGRVVLDVEGKRVAPSYGQLSVVGGTEQQVSVLGEQGEFEIEGLTEGPASLAVEYVDGACEVEVTIPAAEDVVTELGEIVCVPEPGAIRTAP